MGGTSKCLKIQNEVRRILLNKGIENAFSIKKNDLYELVIQDIPKLQITDELTKRKINLVFKHYIKAVRLEGDLKTEFLERVENFHEGKKIEKKTALQKKHERDAHRSEYTLKKNKFLKSSAWRAMRYKVLLQQQGKCQLCGRSRSDGVILHVDHIVPLSVDWEKRLDIDNLQVLCEECNMGKSNNDSHDWR